MSLAPNPIRRPFLAAGRAAVAALVSLLALQEDPSPQGSAGVPPAEQAAAGFSLAEGFEVGLWAAEPDVLNPVCLAVDEHERVFVAETFRHGEGVTDIRDHMQWLDQDLASRTVADRETMLRERLGEDFASFRAREERVRLLVDRDGDGRADAAEVYAAGFDEPTAGIGAGLFPAGDTLWYACIPDLWLLHDRDGDGEAEAREQLFHGFGVHVALLGHDLHGFALGHDGRMYFSIGDRGLHVRTREGDTLSAPDTGSILSCELDGSDLRLYATGLRNPQELVFDERGDLFTADNNSDGGDRARLVRVLEGADSGWRYPYQWVEAPTRRGPWNGERLWEPWHATQPAWILPPIANFADGPAGLTRVPGDAWGEEWQDCFLLCDFRGTPSLSGVHAFRLRPKEAGHELVDVRKLVWGVLATDADFGPGGDLFVSDWVEGWSKPGAGRIWRLAPGQDVGPGSERAAQTRELLSRGTAGLDAFDLRQRLDHPDRRLRLAAQLAMVSGARDQTRTDWQDHRGHLWDAAIEGQGAARLHGVWGLEMLARSDKDAARMLYRLLDDVEVEVRAQTARALGECGHAFSAVKELADDPEPRVRLFVAEALGKYATLHAIPPLIEMLRANDDRDPWIRHACVRALERLDLPAPLLVHAADESSAVRRGVLLVLRRWRDARIARFLDDPDPSLVAETVRAIHDVPIDGARRELAGRSPWGAGDGVPRSIESSDPWIQRRLLAANRRCGAEGRARLAAVVADADAPETLRVEALGFLAEWGSPGSRDPVLGAWRPVEPSDDGADPGGSARGGDVGDGAAEGAPPGLAAELVSAVRSSGSSRLNEAWVRLALALEAADQVPALIGIAEDRGLDGAARATALEALGDLEPGTFADHLRAALSDPDEALRARAFDSLRELPEGEALARLEEALGSPSVHVQQAAIRALGRRGGSTVEAMLASALTELARGERGPEVALELLEASAAASTPELIAAREQALEALERPPSHVVLSGQERAWLHGGDALRGRELFESHAELSCLRCHRLGQQGGTAAGGEVGPDLSDAGRRLTREQVLESILRPDASLASGYERWILLLEDDRLVSGRILSEEGETILLETSAGQRLELETPAVVDRRRDASAMPANLAEKISRRDLRDLVEYLASSDAR